MTTIDLEKEYLQFLRGNSYSQHISADELLYNLKDHVKYLESFIDRWDIAEKTEHDDYHKNTA
jgi:hypothetical protein